MVKRVGKKIGKKAGKKKLKKEDGLAEVFHALGDPVRLSIVRQIHRNGEMPCNSFGLDMPKSTLSHHFRVLRNSGVLGSRPEGTLLMNFLLADQLNERFPGLLKSIVESLR